MLLNVVRVKVNAQKHQKGENIVFQGAMVFCENRAQLSCVSFMNRFLLKLCPLHEQVPNSAYLVYVPFCEQVPRQFPYNNLYLSRGGDPNVAPEGEQPPVQSTYGEYIS